jgi:hypothetical protein
MLSSKQFSEASGFLSTYKDALKCVEQIAERRETYDHYSKTSEGLVTSLQNGEV